MILIFAGYTHLCLKNILHGLYFFRSRFSLNNIHKFKKTCQWFTPGVFQGVYFKVFISFRALFWHLYKGEM